jgi:hypothetical protein
MNDKNTEFRNYLRAGYAALWVETSEEDRAISNLMKSADGYQCFDWDLVSGFGECGNGRREEIEGPVEAMELILRKSESSILFIKDSHRFMEDINVCRTVKNMLDKLKSTDRHLVFISPVQKIPVELEKDITVYSFGLPTISELVDLAIKLRDDNELECEVSADIIGAAKGLTMAEAENSFARSLIQGKSFNRRILEAEKLQAVKKSGLAEIWEPVPIDQVGGLQPLKDYIAGRAKGFLEGAGLATPKGILLTGLPGSGKSLTAKATASILGLPLIKGDLGTLKGSLVGESEANMRKFTQLIDSVSPCVVWLDEIEKSLAGVGSSGKTDGGTGANMFGQLLTWFSESKEKHYIVATCNDINVLLELSQGALMRRFDDVFFVDLPSPVERLEIVKIMCDRYDLDEGARLEVYAANMTNWTGAEIEKLVRGSIFDGVGVAASRIRPISEQNKIVIDKAREWAKWNAILANSGGPTQSVESVGIRKLS